MNTITINGVELAETLKDADMGWLYATQDGEEIFIRHNTGDNTSKENYDNALNDVAEIRSVLEPLGLNVEIEMADHDTIIYRVDEQDKHL